MRIATWNVEWFNALFDDHDRPVADRRWSGRQDIRRDRQLPAVARVMRAVDADAILVVEAPDTGSHRSSVRALEAFAAMFRLRTRSAVTGYPSETQQELTLLYDPDRVTARHDPRGGGSGDLQSGVPRFDRSVRLDIDGDGLAQPVAFSKPPLELALEASGRHLRLIGVHVKSKAPTGARTSADVLRLGLANRHKQLAQCLWLRARVVADLKAGDSLVVLGDFNDGPGLDDYEAQFGRSGVEIVLGGAGPFPLYDPHARMALAQRLGPQPATARFFVPVHGGWLSALLDYVMVSEDLRRLSPAWRIWHPFDDPDCYADETLRAALLDASDHFPVSLDLNL